MDFLTATFILLASAVLAGEISIRLGHVALVGQVAVGVALGPTFLGPYLGLSLTAPVLGTELSVISNIAIFFILFMAGLEVVPEDVWASGFTSAALGVGIFLVPFLVGVVAVPFVLTGLAPSTDTFVALTLSITALPVMAVILIELGILKTRMGSMIMGAAVINELAAMTTYAVLLQVVGHSNVVFSAATAVLEVGVFIGTILTIHMVLKQLRESQAWSRAQKSFSQNWRSREVWFAILMVMALGSSIFSEYLGLTFLVGAFYAGLLVTRESAGPVAHRTIGQVFGTMTWGFFIPLFFAFVGLNMNLRLLLNPTWEVAFVALFAVASLTKIATGYVLSRSLRWKHRDALVIASLVNGRGAVELAIATILLGLGVFTIQIFTLVAGVGLLTTIIAPVGASLARRGELLEPARLRESPAVATPRSA